MVRTKLAICTCKLFLVKVFSFNATFNRSMSGEFTMNTGY